MCLKRPSQKGAIVARNERGRCEHLKGEGHNARYRAFKYRIDEDGKPYVEDIDKSGMLNEVIRWFKVWSLEDSISEKSAMKADKTYEKAKKEKAMSNNNQQVTIDTSDLVSALLTIGETLETSIGVLKAIEKKIDLGIQPAVVSLSAETVKTALESVPAKKPERVKPNVVSDDSIMEYIKAIQPMDIVNMKSKHVYARFVDWCRENGMQPCSPNKFTSRLVKHHNLKTCSEYIRSMSWQVKSAAKA